MKTVRINYWTNLMRCGCGGNVGGNTTVELDEQDVKSFMEVIEPAKEGRDILGYFRVNLSPSLSDKLNYAIISDFRRGMAQDAISMAGKDVFSSKMTEEEFESLSEEELVDRLVAETDYTNEEDYVMWTLKSLPTKTIYYVPSSMRSKKKPQMFIS